MNEYQFERIEEGYLELKEEYLRIMNGKGVTALEKSLEYKSAAIEALNDLTDELKKELAELQVKHAELGIKYGKLL